jgi:hypothetical protein
VCKRCYHKHVWSERPVKREKCRAGGDEWNEPWADPLLAVGYEAQEWDVVEIELADAAHLWAGDFDDEHFDEELDGGAEQVAGGP